MYNPYDMNSSVPSNNPDYAQRIEKPLRASPVDKNSKEFSYFQKQNEACGSSAQISTKAPLNSKSFFPCFSCYGPHWQGSPYQQSSDVQQLRVNYGEQSRENKHTERSYNSQLTQQNLRKEPRIKEKYFDIDHKKHSEMPKENLKSESTYNSGLTQGNIWKPSTPIIEENPHQIPLDTGNENYKGHLQLGRINLQAADSYNSYLTQLRREKTFKEVNAQQVNTICEEHSRNLKENVHPLTQPNTRRQQKAIKQEQSQSQQVNKLYGEQSELLKINRENSQDLPNKLTQSSHHLVDILQKQARQIEQTFFKKDSQQSPIKSLDNLVSSHLESIKYDKNDNKVKKPQIFVKSQRQKPKANKQRHPPEDQENMNPLPHGYGLQSTPYVNEIPVMYNFPSCYGMYPGYSYFQDPIFQSSYLYPIFTNSVLPGINGASVGPHEPWRHNLDRSFNYRHNTTGYSLNPYAKTFVPRMSNQQPTLNQSSSIDSLTLRKMLPDDVYSCEVKTRIALQELQGGTKATEFQPTTNE